MANATGGLTISDTSGSAGGSGGQVTLSAGNNLSVTPSALSVNPQGSNGAGAVLTFAAGTTGTGNGVLTILGALAASGVGTGSGGTLSLNSAGTADISIGGSLTANSGASGTQGGTISVIETGVGGIAFASGASVSANGLAGTGGNIVLQANVGTLTVPSVVVAANGGGASGAGGSVQVVSQSMNISTAALSISAIRSRYRQRRDSCG